MSVTNYTPDKCKYSIGKLVKSVWLVSEEAIKDIRIDNGEAWVEGISETPIRLDCYSIELTDTDTLDERYKFTHTLTFSVNGYANKDDFQDRYYAIVKDDEGTYWLVNPLFPCKVTYTYTLGNEQNHTDFTMSTASNHPVLKLNGMVDSSTYECNEYWLDGIDALWLNEKRYTVHSGNHVMYTNGGFKTVEYNSKSATFTETFDGTNTSHGIEFDVLFSEYKKSWHYNLLEFKDNLYASVIKTRNNKYALCGFSLGMQPGFQVSANDTNNQIDRIHITLNDAHDVGDSIEMYDNIEYEYLSAKTWVYTDEYDGWECVDEGVARYLLQMEVDALENETGNYKVLDGYSSRFPYLNIVDTFDSTETFENVDCGSSSCRLRSSFPSQLTFNDTGCQTYYVKADSDWEIDSSVDYIRVSPSTGSAGESYIVSVCNDIEPSDTVRNSSLTIDYCNTSSTVDVSVEQYEGCFTQGSTYNIPANAKVMTLPSECCINNAREVTSVGVSVVTYQDYLQVTIPENNTGVQRSIVLLVTYCDGTSENIILNQSDTFEKWVSEGEECIGNDLYGIYRLYTGTTSSSITARTETTKTSLIEALSTECLPRMYTWERTNKTVCVTGTPEVKYMWERSNETSCVYTDEVFGHLTFTASEPGEIGFSANSSDILLKYSVNEGLTWSEDVSGVTIPVTAGQKIMWKGFNAYKENNKNIRFNSTCRFSASGNVMSLLYEDGFKDSSASTIWHNTLEGLFSNCTGLTSVSRDLLPATILNNAYYNTYRPYASMFAGCTSLTNAPDLPATRLADYSCYQYMFSGCTSLTTVPSDLLPATRVGDECYRGMFADCTSLTTAPVISATTSAENCYNSMFRGCTSLTTSPELPATSLGNYCYSNMFQGCTSLTTPPALPATTLAHYCYQSMFADCTSLTTIPSGYLSARNNLSYYSGCYKDMFKGCTSLTTVPSDLLPATKVGDECYRGMFQNCTSLTGVSATFLPATDIETSAYTSMFQGCTSLTAVPDLPTEDLTEGCYKSMFKGCTSLTAAQSILPATMLTSSCYEQMFYGCTSLTTSPIIKGYSLRGRCYFEMFCLCSSLTNITCLAEYHISDSDATHRWVYGVSATGTFTRKTGISWPSGVDGIPTGWRIIDG